MSQQKVKKLLAQAQASNKGTTKKVSVAPTITPKVNFTVLPTIKKVNPVPSGNPTGLAFSNRHRK